MTDAEMDKKWKTEQETRRQKWRRMCRKCAKIQIAIPIAIILMFLGLFRGDNDLIVLGTTVLYIIEVNYLILIANRGLLTKESITELIFINVSLVVSYVKHFFDRPIEVALTVLQYALLVIGCGIVWIMIRKAEKSWDELENDTTHKED